ncbi:MAG: FixH family protein [Hydrogenophilaceae bacterium]|nr:FixH family protein [Hydrogenophilaceae bacterium]
MSSLASPKPWYRERWPWLLAIMPTLAVIGGFTTAWFAVTSNDGLVVDDYYKQGKAINQTKERDRNAQTLGLTARLIPLGSTLRVSLAGSIASPTGSLNLKLMHPTRPGDDHDIALVWNGSGYTGTLPKLSSAHYRVQITPEFGNWRLTGEYRPGSEVTLSPMP